jgi:competence protein ComEA
LLPQADAAALNRAALLIDGQRVTVPFLPGTGDRPEAAASPDAQPLLNINTATIEELDELPGIGDVRATAIVDYRNQFGPFQSIEELLFVEGISEGLLEDLRPLITVNP